MGSYYLVVKNINGRRYYYHQRTWREGKKVKCHCIYRGPVDKVARRAARFAYSPDEDYIRAAKAEGWTLNTQLNKWCHPSSSAMYVNNPRWGKYACEDHSIKPIQDARLASSPKGSMNAGMNTRRMNPADAGMAAARRDDEIKRIGATILSIDDSEYELVAHTDKGTIRTAFDAHGKIRHEWDSPSMNGGMTKKEIKNYFDTVQYQQLNKRTYEIESDISKLDAKRDPKPWKLELQRDYEKELEEVKRKMDDMERAREEPASGKGIDKAIAEKGYYMSPECEENMREVERRQERNRLLCLYAKLSHPSGEGEYIEAREDLINDHIVEIEAHGADALNPCWVQDDYSVASKTDKGIMTTTIHPDGTITHEWGR